MSFITAAPLVPRSETNCDGVGTMFCPVGTCYTGLNSYIGCCSVSSCLARTTCIPFSALSETDCDFNTGGCVRCTDAANPSCVTLSNTVMNQFAMYCSSVSLFSEVGYVNTVTTGSTAALPSTTSTSTSTSSSSLAVSSKTSSIPSPTAATIKNEGQSVSQVPIIVGVSVSCSVLLIILLLVGCVVHKKYLPLNKWHRFFYVGGSRRRAGGRRFSLEKDNDNARRSLPLTDPSAVDYLNGRGSYGESNGLEKPELSRSPDLSTRGYTAIPSQSPQFQEHLGGGPRVSGTSVQSWTPTSLSSFSPNQHDSAAFMSLPNSPSRSQDGALLARNASTASRPLSPTLLTGAPLQIVNPSPPSPPPPELESIPVATVFEMPAPPPDRPVFSRLPSSGHRAQRSNGSNGSNDMSREYSIRANPWTQGPSVTDPPPRITSPGAYMGSEDGVHDNVGSSTISGLMGGSNSGYERLSSYGSPGYVTPESAMTGLGLQTRSAHKYTDSVGSDTG